MPLQFEISQVNFLLKKTKKHHSLEKYNIEPSLRNNPQCPTYNPKCSTCEEPGKCDPFSTDKTMNQDQSQSDLGVEISRRGF